MFICNLACYVSDEQMAAAMSGRASVLTDLGAADQSLERACKARVFSAAFFLSAGISP